MIFAIDATNWTHTLWHTVGSQEPILAADRLQAAVHYLSQRSDGIQTIACWDSRSFRHDIHPEYKANRKEKEQGLQDALDQTRTAFEPLAANLEMDGYEADDLLASIAARANHRNTKCVLASADKDLYQCLRNGTVSILRNFQTDNLARYGAEGRTLTNPVWMTESTFREKYELSPSQWTDYQALCGQPGDNIKGCPGFGPVATTKALKSCGTVLEMLRDPWKVPCSDRQRRNLFAWKPHAELTLRLVTLVKTVEEVDEIL